MTGVSRRKITLFFIRDYRTEKINLPFKDAHAMSIKHMHAEVSGNSFAEIFYGILIQLPFHLQASALLQQAYKRTPLEKNFSNCWCPLGLR